MLLEDVANRAFGNGTDPQFPELADNPGIAPGVFLGQPNYQSSNLFACATSSTFCSRDAFLSISLFLSNPPQKGAGRDDRHDLVKGLAELGSEFQQPLPYFGRDRNARRELATQDFVLNLQIADLSSQFFLVSTGNYEQQRAEDRDHRCWRAEAQSIFGPREGAILIPLSAII